MLLLTLISALTLESMSTDEKIGQLFMVAGYVDPEFANKEIGNPKIIEEIDNYITKYHIGGIAFVGPSESGKQVSLINHYQSISKTPLLIAQDLEWGLSQRLIDGMRFPKNITLGAVEDNDLIYQMGKEIGHQAKSIGVHMNLSPVLDVNIEPENIVINARSFGSSPQAVAEKGVAMIRGLQDAGLIASAKHFPGLGDITVDPHFFLPTNHQGIERLREVELYPFVQAIGAGVLSIQTDHVMVPALDPLTPSSLSPIIVTDLLQKELGFKGLVLSGALRMKALTNHMSEEQIVLRAFLAGHDMLLMPQNFPVAYNALKTALENGTIAESEIDRRVFKILQLKDRIQLAPIEKQQHSPCAKDLKKKLFQTPVSFIRRNIAPKSGPTAYIQLGEPKSTEFLNSLDIMPTENILNQLDQYSSIILAVYPRRTSIHGIPESYLPAIRALEQYQEKVIVVYFGNPFGLHFFDGYSNFLMAYEDDPDAQEAAANILKINHF